MLKAFNPYGLLFIICILVPNIIYAYKNRVTDNIIWHNRFVEILEQIGRYGCIFFMIFNFTRFKTEPSSPALTIYLIINIILIFCYGMTWVFFFKKRTRTRAVLLAILPSIIFLFSGSINYNFPLILSTIIFAPNHFLISYNNH